MQTDQTSLAADNQTGNGPLYVSDSSTTPKIVKVPIILIATRLVDFLSTLPIFKTERTELLPEIKELQQWDTLYPLALDARTHNYSGSVALDNVLDSYKLTRNQLGGDEVIQWICTCLNTILQIFKDKVFN